MPQEVQARLPGADKRHQRQAARIETLVQEIAAFPDAHARATAQELVQALLDMYGEGLARLLELTAEAEVAGLALIDTFAEDELLSSLFLLHDLHPLDIETRVMQALDEVRPYLKSHGGNVELVKVEDGIAHLRLQGSCHGCPSSTMTLKLAIEEAIYKAAPDLNGLQVEGVTEMPSLIQLGNAARAQLAPLSQAEMPPLIQLGNAVTPPPGIPVTFVPPRRHKDKDGTQSTQQAGGWTVVEGLQSLPNGTLQVLTVQKEAVLFCQIADTYYAYHNRCGNCNAPLDGGTLAGTTLRCASCERHYDLCRAGRCLDGPELFLQAIPLLVENGKVKVAFSGSAKDDQVQAAVSTQPR